jgi:hypothetical protein
MLEKGYALIDLSNTCSPFIYFGQRTAGPGRLLELGRCTTACD